MTDALRSARERLEAYAKAMAQPVRGPAPRADQAEFDALMLRRLTNDLIEAARQFDPSVPF